MECGHWCVRGVSACCPDGLHRRYSHTLCEVAKMRVLLLSRVPPSNPHAFLVQRVVHAASKLGPRGTCGGHHLVGHILRVTHYRVDAGRCRRGRGLQRVRRRPLRFGPSLMGGRGCAEIVRRPVLSACPTPARGGARRDQIDRTNHCAHNDENTQTHPGPVLSQPVHETSHGDACV